MYNFPLLHADYYRCWKFCEVWTHEVKCHREGSLTNIVFFWALHIKNGFSNFIGCYFGARGLCLIFLQTLHMKSNFVTFVPCNWFVIFFSNLDKFFMKNVNISYQQLLEDLQCYFCQFMPRYNIGIYKTT